MSHLQAAQTPKQFKVQQNNTLVSPKTAISFAQQVGRTGICDQLNISRISLDGLPSFNPQTALGKLERVLQNAEKQSQVNQEEVLANLCVKKGYLEFSTEDAKRKLDVSTALKVIKALGVGKGSSIQAKRIQSPIENLNDTSWAKDSTFKNIGIRAEGSILNAIKILPTVREDAVYLSPIFENSNGALYAQSSLNLDPDTVKKDLESLNKHLPRGMSPLTEDDLMKAFVDAAHVLDKTVGMDLIPHVGDWSDFILEDPDIFRWQKLSEDKSHVEIGNGIDLTDLNDPAIKAGKNESKTIQSEIKESLLSFIEGSSNPKLKQIASKMKNASGPELYKAVKEQVPEEKENARNAVMSDLRFNKGYVTVPVASWNATKPSEYAGWNHEKNYPMFNCGGDEPYGNLTPFKFYNNAKTARGEIIPGDRNEKAIRFFTELFPKMREKYGFDYIRADMAKHAVDSNNNAVEGSQHNSAAKLGFATSEVWKEVIDRARDASKPGGHPAVAAIAEAFEEDMVPIAGIGFDATLGSDQYWMPEQAGNVRERMEGNAKWVEKLGHEAKKLGGFVSRPITKFFCVDTHDCAVGSNQHRFNRGGSNAVKLAMSLGLFSSAGEGKRPMYNIIGNEDNSVFLNKDGQDLTNHLGQIQHRNDRGFNKVYHRLFNIYNDVKDILTDKSAKTYWYDNQPSNIETVQVKSPHGDLVTIFNTSNNQDAWYSPMINRPGDAQAMDPVAQKGLVTVEENTLNTREPQVKRFARKVGDRLIANLPPCDSKVFRVSTPTSEPEWVKESIQEIAKAIGSQNLETLAKGQFKQAQAEMDTHTPNMAMAEVDIGQSHFLVKKDLTFENPADPKSLSIEKL